MRVFEVKIKFYQISSKTWYSEICTFIDIIIFDTHFWYSMYLMMYEEKVLCNVMYLLLISFINRSVSTLNILLRIYVQRWKSHEELMQIICVVQNGEYFSGLFVFVFVCIIKNKPLLLLVSAWSSVSIFIWRLETLCEHKVWESLV